MVAMLNGSRRMVTLASPGFLPIAMPRRKLQNTIGFAPAATSGMFWSMTHRVAQQRRRLAQLQTGLPHVGPVGRVPELAHHARWWSGSSRTPASQQQLCRDGRGEVDQAIAGDLGRRRRSGRAPPATPVSSPRGCFTPTGSVDLPPTGLSDRRHRSAMTTHRRAGGTARPHGRRAAGRYLTRHSGRGEAVALREALGVGSSARWGA